MKKLSIILCLLISTYSFSQKEGQLFCEGDATASYFPLSIHKKKIIWQNTFYIESKTNEKIINDKTYIGFNQLWEGKERYVLYLREEDGKILQYEACCDKETIRYDEAFNAGQKWKTADNKTEYMIETLSGTLQTPYCKYTNLLVLKSSFSNGTFKFYYIKGYGYVGATLANELISYVSPE